MSVQTIPEPSSEGKAEDAVTEDAVAAMFPSTGIYDVKYWDGYYNLGKVLCDGLWLVVVDQNGKRWPIRHYSKQCKKWVHQYEKELNPICRPFIKDKLKGEDPPIQGFLSVYTFMRFLYVHSAVPVDAEEKDLTLEYTSLFSPKF